MSPRRAWLREGSPWPHDDGGHEEGIVLSDIAAFAIESGFGFWALVVAAFVGFGGAVVRRGNSRRRRMI